MQAINKIDGLLASSKMSRYKPDHKFLNELPIETLILSMLVYKTISPLDICSVKLTDLRKLPCSQNIRI